MGQLERTQIELINLSLSLAGNRRGAAGWLFGAPLIVAATLTPDVTQHCPEAPVAEWGCRAGLLLGQGVQEA